MQLFSNTAAALPAELGPDGKAVERRSAARRFRMLNPTRAALAWHKRVTAQRERRQVRALGSTNTTLFCCQKMLVETGIEVHPHRSPL